jgi:hypothetical protein
MAGFFGMPSGPYQGAYNSPMDEETMLRLMQQQGLLAPQAAPPAPGGLLTDFSGQARPVNPGHAGNVVMPRQSVTPYPVNQNPPDMKVAPQVPQEQEAPSFRQSVGGILSGVNNSLQQNPMITGLAMGLLSGPDWGSGIASGLQYGQQMAQSSNKTALERVKLARESAQLTGNAALIKRAFNVSDNEAMGAAGNNALVSEAMKRLSPSELYETRRDKSGNLIQEDVRTGKINLLRPADETYEALTDPAERKKYGIPESDKGIYRVSSLGKIEAVGSPSTNVSVNTAANPIVAGAGEQFVEQLKEAKAAGDTIRAIQSARAELTAPGGVIAGKFANERLQLQKLGALFGVSDPKAIVNTETFVTQIKPIVLANIKGLGAGSAISNADREFVLQAVGGDMKLDPGTLSRVLDISERAAAEKIERHNSVLDALQPAAGSQLKDVMPLLRVQAPTARQQEQTTTQPQRFIFDPKTGGFR